MLSRTKGNEFHNSGKRSSVEPIKQKVSASAVAVSGKSLFRLTSICWVSLLTVLLLSVITVAGDLKGKVTIAGATSNANAVVYIEKVDSVFDPPANPAVMDQNHLAFKPEVLPILAGTTVKFLNSDEVLHDIFTPSPCAGSFNLGSFPPGESKTHTFKDAGCDVLILCDIHPEMQAWIKVLQNPYFAVTAEDGAYSIKDIPPGRYVLTAWFGYYKTQSIRIIVPHSGTINADFLLKQ